MKKTLISLFLVGLSSVGLIGCSSIHEEIQTTNLTITETIKDIENEVFSADEILNGILDRVDFPYQSVLDETYLTDIYNLNVEDVELYTGLMPSVSSASELSIFKVNSKNKQKVLKAIYERKNSQLESFKNVLDDQYELLNNSEILERNDYIVFISAEDDIKEEIISILKSEIDSFDMNEENQEQKEEVTENKSE